MAKPAEQASRLVRLNRAVRSRCSCWRCGSHPNNFMKAAPAAKMAAPAVRPLASIKNDHKNHFLNG